MSDSRDEQLAHNEVIFRTVNEHIASLAENIGREAIYDFICECADIDCFGRIPLTIEQYEAVRTQGAWFLLQPGHQDIEIELVAENHGEYLVVEKDGVAGLLAEREDPRG
jgi:hypothetical protein